MGRKSNSSVRAIRKGAPCETVGYYSQPLTLMRNRRSDELHFHCYRS